MQDRITFTATIPPTESAIKIHGDGGARIMLDVAESCMGAFMPMLVMRGKIFRVTVELKQDKES